MTFCDLFATRTNTVRTLYASHGKVRSDMRALTGIDRAHVWTKRARSALTGPISDLKQHITGCLRMANLISERPLLDLRCPVGTCSENRALPGLRRQRREGTVRPKKNITVQKPGLSGPFPGLGVCMLNLRGPMPGLGMHVPWLMGPFYTLRDEGPNPEFCFVPG